KPAALKQQRNLADPSCPNRNGQAEMKARQGSFSPERDSPSPDKPLRPCKLCRLLLLPLLVAPLWVASYNASEPALAGIPFFYWYQLLWIALSVVLIGVVYRIEH